MRSIPEGFRVVRKPGGRVWILREDFPISTHQARWDGWLAGREGIAISQAGGRVPARAVSLEPFGRVVIRRYFHGGMLSFFTRDWFWGCGRLVREVAVSEELRRRGVATPQILAVYLRGGAAGLYRGCLLSQMIPGGVNLREWLSGEGQRRDLWGRVLAPVARAISSLHAAGCVHGDLNLSNLLLSPSGTWILDLDGARMSGGLGAANRGANLMRLYRSLRKESARQEPLSVQERLAFLRRYAAGDREVFRRLVNWFGARWTLGQLRGAISRHRRLDRHRKPLGGQ